MVLLFRLNYFVHYFKFNGELGKKYFNGIYCRVFINLLTKGYFYGLLASIVSVLCLTFLYIDPNYDFHISDPNDFMLIFSF